MNHNEIQILLVVPLLEFEKELVNLLTGFDVASILSLLQGLIIHRVDLKEWKKCKDRCRRVIIQLGINSNRMFELMISSSPPITIIIAIIINLFVLLQGVPKKSL